jgi:hypothetical protein
MCRVLSEPQDSIDSGRLSKFDGIESLMSRSGRWFGRFSRIGESLRFL